MVRTHTGVEGCVLSELEWYGSKAWYGRSRALGIVQKGFMRQRLLFGRPNIEETGAELATLFEARHADVDRAFHRLPSTFFVFRFMPSNTSCQLIFTEGVFLNE